MLERPQCWFTYTLSTFAVTFLLPSAVQIARDCHAAALQPLHPYLYLLVSWAWRDWPLTWLTNHCPSVLWQSVSLLVGYMTRKIVSEMTYNVSSGTLNPTIPVSTKNRQVNLRSLNRRLHCYNIIACSTAGGAKSENLKKFNSYMYIFKLCSLLGHMETQVTRIQ